MDEEQGMDGAMGGGANGTGGHDDIEGGRGDDVIRAGGGDDIVQGGYGDDDIEGGAGDDLLDGGRGSDFIKGGDGDDTLLMRADAGEQRIGQLAIGEPTRNDPDGEVNEERQKLAGWEDMPLVSDDVAIGGKGKDQFLISPQINAKEDIIAKHIQDDGTVDWAGVAGENNELHDHWVDAMGFDVIGDYDADEDSVAVIGHTANVKVEFRDTDGDGDEESIVTVYSSQHGGGGAHDEDLMGIVVVHGDRLEAGDIQTDANVTYGIVETNSEADLDEALTPDGETKVTEIDGEMVYGYDTRDENGGLGPVTGSPEDFNDNPWLAEASALFADPGEGEEPIADGEAPAQAGGLKGYWSFENGADGSYGGAGTDGTIKAYTLYENQARLRTDGAAEGPDGSPDGSLSFDGDDDFAYLAHDPSFEVANGTIAVSVKPDDLDGKGAIVTKDSLTTLDGGHVRLVRDGDKLHIRVAPADGGANEEWVTNAPVFEAGAWTHLAMSFNDEGVVVYADGEAIPDDGWRNVEGGAQTPGSFGGAGLENNEEAWIFGADTRRTELNDTAAEFATDAEDLESAFSGQIADFAVYGGPDAGDALDAEAVARLAAEGSDAVAAPDPAPEEPVEPAEPMEPEEPVDPIEVADPEEPAEPEEPADGSGGEAEFEQVSDTVRRFELGADDEGVVTVSDFDLNTSGSETSYDFLRLEGMMDDVSGDAEMVELVRIVENDDDGATDAMRVGDDLGFKLQDDGAVMILKGIAGQLDAEALRAAGIDDVASF